MVIIWYDIKNYKWAKNEEVNLMKMMTYWRMTMVIRAKRKLIGMTLVEQ